jgi:hypothetical protein
MIRKKTNFNANAQIRAQSLGTSVADCGDSPRGEVRGMSRTDATRRFPLRLPLVFRMSTDQPWRRATSTALSNTTVSFVTRSKLAPRSRVQVRFVVRLNSVRSEVECWTKLTRARKLPGATVAWRYTAAIESYEFVKVA